MQTIHVAYGKVDDRRQNQFNDSSELLVSQIIISRGLHFWTRPALSVERRMSEIDANHMLLRRVEYLKRNLRDKLTETRDIHVSPKRNFDNLECCIQFHSFCIFSYIYVHI